MVGGRCELSCQAILMMIEACTCWLLVTYDALDLHATIAHWVSLMACVVWLKIQTELCSLVGPA